MQSIFIEQINSDKWLFSTETKNKSKTEGGGKQRSALRRAVTQTKMLQESNMKIRSKKKKK